jgi:PAS domain-containing protein
MTEKNLAKQKQINPWHFIWLSVVFSELFTAFLNTIQSFIWYGKISPDLLMIGALDALFIPLIVAPIVIYFIKHTAELKKINERFQQEIMVRKRVELELRKSESRLRTVMENTPVVLFALDRKGVFTLAEEDCQRWPQAQRGCRPVIFEFTATHLQCSRSPSGINR